jgi:hypothetical protein
MQLERTMTKRSWMLKYEEPIRSWSEGDPLNIIEPGLLEALVIISQELGLGGRA